MEKVKIIPSEGMTTISTNEFMMLKKMQELDKYSHLVNLMDKYGCDSIYIYSNKDIEESMEELSDLKFHKEHYKKDAERLRHQILKLQGEIKELKAKQSPKGFKGWLIRRLSK
jgi:DNA repair ATPase RecN